MNLFCIINSFLLYADDLVLLACSGQPSARTGAVRSWNESAPPSPRPRFSKGNKAGATPPPGQQRDFGSGGGVQAWIDELVPRPQ